jgi:hypothetical protein
MTRGKLIAVCAGLSLLALVAWIASHTRWADTRVPMPLKGEARTNPFYAAQRFSEALGARTAWDREFTAPPTSSVIVLSAWHWDLSPGRRRAFEHWVESGGRLVVDRTLVGGETEFARWSGVARRFGTPDRTGKRTPADDEECVDLQEERHGMPTGGSAPVRHSICDLDGISSLAGTRSAAWALRGDSGIQAMRVELGRGSVTVINATPFRERSLFDGDHGWLLVAATGLRRGDDVHFMSEEAQPTLVALLWQRGAPVVVIALALVVLLLWRGGVRFGPLAAAPETARRSLAEFINGTGQFALRHGSGDALHAAVVRALGEAAQRRVPAYPRLSPGERAAVLADLTGFDRDALAVAVHSRIRRAHEQRDAIALLEAARRQTLLTRARSSHGTR